MLSRWRFNRALEKLANSSHEALSSYAKAQWPDASLPAREAPFLALDFELDGLRKNADLLQAGWLHFDGRSLPLAGAQTRDIRSKTRLDNTAVTIHSIGEQRASEGPPLRAVLQELVQALAGRVLVAHAAFIEKAAIQRAARNIFGADLPVRTICTLTLERTIHPNLTAQEAYRLGTCRERYGLPEYRAHDALTDAIAAAELFQAQLSRLPPDVSIGRLERARISA